MTFLSDPEWVNSLAQATLALAAVGAVIGGLMQYSLARKSNQELQDQTLKDQQELITSGESKWMSELFRTFYLDPGINATRLLIEHQWWERVDPIVQQFLSRPAEEISLDGQQAEDESGLTNLLNFLEYVLYLRGKSRLPDGDVDKVFGYWLRRWFDADRYAAMRVYLAACDYELLTNELQVRVTAEGTPAELSYLAVYGTLRPGETNAGLLQDCEYLGRGFVHGALYQDSYYPVLARAESGVVEVDVFRVGGAKFIELDVFEEIDPQSSNNEYRREFVPVFNFSNSATDPVRGAWVYSFTRPTAGLTRLLSTSWTGTDRQR